LRQSPDSAFIAWVPSDSRPRSVAAALGGDFRTFYDLRIQRKPLVPLRYAISALRTLAYLIRCRPRAVIMQAPPVPAAALVWLYGRVTRRPVVIDSHPVSFGHGGTAIDRAMRPLLAWLAARSNGCIVTTPGLGAEIERWGGRSIVVHEAPPAWDEMPAPQRGRNGRRSVLFVCTFAPDEPVDAVLDAARRLPEIHFGITGDLRKAPKGLEGKAPENVEFLGYLLAEDYERALAEADVVLVLTDRSESVPRSAYEAVYALRPLVMSDWPHLQDLFPTAIGVNHDGAGIAAGVDEAFRRADELAAAARDARQIQDERWSHQLDELRDALGLNETATPAGIR
jgi:glycosyltransferase involved in cell wall biosynthesis